MRDRRHSWAAQLCALTALALWGALGWAKPAGALEISEFKRGGLCKAVALSGSIDPNEAPQAIKRMIAAADRCGTRTIVMNQMPGGSVGDAIHIGRAIRARDYATAMLPNTVCASACGLIYLGGVQRYWLPNARFLIHRPYTHQKFESMAEENAMMENLRRWLIDYVHSMGGNPDYVEAMYAVGPGRGLELRTLGSQDLTRLALVTTVGSPF